MTVFNKAVKTILWIVLTATRSEIFHSSFNASTMLAKKYRLSANKDIQYVLKRGEIYFSPFFNIKILKNNLKNSRFCIVISTNISKKAVIRNRAKRQIRAIISKNITKISQNYDFIILTKPAVTVTAFKDLEKTFEFLLRKAGIWQ